jgi:hypothetical protein
MALMLTSDTSHANRNLAFVTTKNKIFFMFHEKESLTKMLSDCKQQLENAKAMEKREEKVRQSRDDASTIQHLQKLYDET